MVHHFATNDDADLDFLAYVVGKVNNIRDDLGSTGEVFDEALERRLIAGEDVQRVRQDLVDSRIERARGRASVPRSALEDTGAPQLEQLEAFAAELDLDADTLRETLNVALSLGVC